MDLSWFAKVIIGMGIVLIGVGVLLLVAGRLTGGQGWRLPGDLVFRRDNVTIYIPLATSLLLSLILTLVFYFLGRR